MNVRLGGGSRLGSRSSVEAMPEGRKEEDAGSKRRRHMESVFIYFNLIFYFIGVVFCRYFDSRRCVRLFVCRSFWLSFVL